jgi:UDP-N-acetylmuramyl pentapeptide phosphotransferase/UDP-N-acetylglucosamine-1-phosphate transferase
LESGPEASHRTHSPTSATMSDEITAVRVAGGAATMLISAALSAALIIILRPLLQRYALARPNARSSHGIPTPQGGGIAVITATIASASFASWAIGFGIATPLPTIFAAAIVMACVGLVDDIRPLAVVPRLLLQTLMVAAVIHVLPADLRILPFLPWWLEQILLVVGGVWFVNLVNFMDGIDWMTVVEIIPIAAALVCIGVLGAVPTHGIIVALALGGAMIGFAFFNRPVAKLFLGDVGSLPIGLIVGWLLLMAAGAGAIVAAILLPLYYLADATITLMRRLLAGEPVWKGHRTHFYQRATDKGFSVTDVVTRVFAVNLILALLAIVSVVWPGIAISLSALACGVAVVAWLLVSFGRGRP